MNLALLAATGGTHALVTILVAVLIVLAILFAIFYVGRLLQIPEPVLVILALIVVVIVLLYLA
jgi:hypothetical protein